MAATQPGAGTQQAPQITTMIDVTKHRFNKPTPDLQSPGGRQRHSQPLLWAGPLSPRSSRNMTQAPHVYLEGTCG